MFVGEWGRVESLLGLLVGDWGADLQIREGGGGDDHPDPETRGAVSGLSLV